jgi:hypothetical protein
VSRNCWASAAAQPTPEEVIYPNVFPPGVLYSGRDKVSRPSERGSVALVFATEALSSPPGKAGICLPVCFDQGYSRYSSGCGALPAFLLLARQQSPEAINTLVSIMQNEKAPPAARVAAANLLLDRGYGKPAQPISQTLTKIDPNTMTDAELAAIVRNGVQPDDRPH